MTLMAFCGEEHAPTESWRHDGPGVRRADCRFYRKIKIPDEVIEGLGETGTEGE